MGGRSKPKVLGPAQPAVIRRASALRSDSSWPTLRAPAGIGRPSGPRSKPKMLDSRRRDLRLCTKLNAHVCLAGPKASQCQQTSYRGNQETMA
jgi:hypothetical protein